MHVPVGFSSETLTVSPNLKSVAFILLLRLLTSSVCPACFSIFFSGAHALFTSPSPEILAFPNYESYALSHLLSLCISRECMCFFIRFCKHAGPCSFKLFFFCAVSCFRASAHGGKLQISFCSIQDGSSAASRSVSKVLKDSSNAP